KPRLLVQRSAPCPLLPTAPQRARSARLQFEKQTRRENRRTTDNEAISWRKPFPSLESSDPRSRETLASRVIGHPHLGRDRRACVDNRDTRFGLGRRIIPSSREFLSLDCQFA